MLSLTWKRCSWRRSASVSCAGACVVTFRFTLLGRIGRHREETAPGQSRPHAVLHVRRNGPIERAQEIVGDRAVLGREDLRGAEPNVWFDRAEVLEDAPSKEPHHVRGVVQVHAGQACRDGQQELVVMELQPREERDRRREVAERIHPAGEERSSARTDRCDHLAVDELAGGAVDRWNDDPLAELDGDGRDDVEVEGRRRVRAEEPERKDEQYARDAEPSEQRPGEDALDEEGDERRARVDRCVQLAEEVLAPSSGPGGRLVEPDQVEEVPELHEEVPEEDADAERPEHLVRRDRAVSVERVLQTRRDAFGPLFRETAAMALGTAAVQDESDEA